MQHLLEQCYTAFEQHQSIFITMFLAGFAGGLTHCAGMCGPFIVAQTQNGNHSDTYLQKLSGAALLPYHFGRMTTYIILGIIAAILSKQIIGTSLQQWVSTLFLIFAGIIFIISALPKAKKNIRFFSYSGISKIGLILGKIAKPLFNKPTGLSGYGLGILLGLLPCGLVFAALMVVSTASNVITATLAMMFFTIGTFPALFIVGISSNIAYRKLPNIMQLATRGIMIFNGFSLFALAGNMVL